MMMAYQTVATPCSGDVSTTWRMIWLAYYL